VEDEFLKKCQLDSNITDTDGSEIKRQRPAKCFAIVVTVKAKILSGDENQQKQSAK